MMLKELVYIWTLLLLPAKTTAQNDSSDLTNLPINNNDSELTNEYFPADLFTIEQSRSGAAILHLIGCLYMFFCLGVVYYEYLLPALAQSVNKWNICPETAASTLFAVVIALPSIVSKLVGVFFAMDYVKPGSQVGSAVFNTVFSIMVASFAAWRQPVAASSPTLIRNMMFYLVTVILFSIFCLDGQLVWWEAIILITIYTIFSLYLHFKDQIEKKICCCLKKVQQGDFYEGGGFSFHEESALEDQEMKGRSDISDVEPESSQHKAPLERKPRGVYWFLATPIFILFYVNDRGQNHCFQKWRFIWQIFVCTTAVMGIMYLITWWASIFGQAVGLPALITGIAFVGIGSGVPLMVTCALLARQRYINSVISLAFGLNILAMALETPLVSLLKTAIFQISDPVDTRGLGCSMFLIIIIHIITLTLFRLCGSRTTILVGVLMIIIYILFVFIAIAFEYQYVMCPI